MTVAIKRPGTAHAVRGADLSISLISCIKLETARIIESVSGFFYSSAA